MPVKITIDERYLQLAGSNSLMGALVKQSGGAPNPQETITLEFPQTSLNWRRQNKGPQDWIMPEYAVMCLLEDVVRLQKEGFKIEIVEKPGDPSNE